MKHKHAELIKAWADGAEIERKEIYCRYEYNSQVDEVKEKWVSDGSPLWSYTEEYRIKPEQKFDIVKTFLVSTNSVFTGVHISNGLNEKHNLKLIFDGETREFKSAEVLK